MERKLLAPLWLDASDYTTSMSNRCDLVDEMLRAGNTDVSKCLHILDGLHNLTFLSPVSEDWWTSQQESMHSHRMNVLRCHLSLRRYIHDMQDMSCNSNKAERTLRDSKRLMRAAQRDGGLDSTKLHIIAMICTILMGDKDRAAIHIDVLRRTKPDDLELIRIRNWIGDMRHR